MNEVIQLQRRVVTVSEGTQAETFETVGRFYATVTPVSARERFSEQTEVYTETYRFKLRRSLKTSQTGSGYRIVWNGQNYEVINKPNASDRFFVEIQARYTDPIAVA